MRLEQTILKALEKDLSARYQSAAALRADLLAAQRDPNTVAPPPIPSSRPLGADEPTRRLPRPLAAEEPTHRLPPERPRRKRWRAVLMVLFIIFMINRGKWFQSDREREEPQVRDTTSAFPDQPPPADGIERATPEPTPPPAAPPPPPEGTEKGAVLPPNAIPDIPAIVGPAIATSINKALDEALGEVARGARGRTVRGVALGGPALIKALRNAPPETYDLVYAATDPEAMTVALQIRGVLERAGWTTGSMAEIPEPAAQLGIFAPRATPGVTALTNWARRSGLQPDFRRVPSLTRPRIVIGKQQ